MKWVHLIVCRVDRCGYRCDAPLGCGLFHRDGDPAFDSHRAFSREGLQCWTETLAMGIDDVTGQAVRLPAEVGLAALYDPLIEADTEAQASGS